MFTYASRWCNSFLVPARVLCLSKNVSPVLTLFGFVFELRDDGLKLGVRPQGVVINFDLQVAPIGEALGGDGADNVESGVGVLFLELFFLGCELTGRLATPDLRDAHRIDGSDFNEFIVAVAGGNSRLGRPPGRFGVLADPGEDEHLLFAIVVVVW